MNDSVPQPEAPWAPRPPLLLAAALFLVAAAYANALDGGFVWDDHALIEKQPLIETLHPLQDYFLRMFWADPLSLETRNFYRPLTTLSYAVDHAVGGGAPFTFHLTNVLLHLACCGLVFALARKLGASAVAAALACAIWGVQPRLTESVAWVSGRTDVLAALGLLAALVLWNSEPDRWGRRVFAALALLGGLFSKEVAIAGLAGIVGWEVATKLRTGAPWSRVVKNLVPPMIAVVVYAALRVATPQTQGNVHHLGWKRVEAAIEAVGWYVLMVVDALRPRLQIGLLGVPEWPVAVIGLLSIAVGIWLVARWIRSGPSPRSAMLLLVSCTALVLVLHLVPLAVNVVAADRFLYVPTIGLAVALALWLPPLARRHRWIAPLCFAGALFFAGQTHFRNQDWLNELRLWRVAERTSNRLNAMPLLNIGYVQSEQNMDAEALETYREARRRMDEVNAQRGLESAENLDVLQLNVALLLQKLGRYDEARRALDELVQGSPRYKKARYAQVRLALRRLQFDEAQRLLEETQRALGGDEVARELTELIATTREQVAKLPPETEGEEVSLVARRAELYDTIGADFEAIQHWQKVLAMPSAPPQLVQRAAGYLAFKARPEVAQKAVEQLQARVGHTEISDQLAEHVEGRVREIAEAG